MEAALELGNLTEVGEASCKYPRMFKAEHFGVILLRELRR